MSLSDKKYIFGILTARFIDWYIYGSNWGGGGPPVNFFFLGGGSPDYFWATSTEFFIHHQNPQLKPSWLPPFLNKLGKRGGGCGHVQKSEEAHALGCRPRGKSSQWSSISLRIFRIVPAWGSQWNSEEIDAMWGCASQCGCLVGHVCMGVRISVFALYLCNSATIQIQVLMSMHMDAELKKEQIGTPFVWVGALKGGIGGAWSLRGVHPKKWTCCPKENFLLGRLLRNPLNKFGCRPWLRRTYIKCGGQCCALKVRFLGTIPVLGVKRS